MRGLDGVLAIEELNCKTCRYWDHHSDPDQKNEHDDDKEGYCRRYPPAFDPGWLAMNYLVYDEVDFLSGEELGYWQQPLTVGVNWCGEYAQGKRPKK